MKRQSFEFYAVKSSTFKGKWVKDVDNISGKYITKNIYAERYLGIGDKRIIQMNGMNYDRNKLLLFKTQKAAEAAAKCANATLKKLTVVGERGEMSLNEYKVIAYKPRKPITAVKAIPMFGGTAYKIVE